MTHFRKYGLAAGLAIGLVIGLVLGGMWPHTPIHASATDRIEQYAIATGFIDPETEGVFYLDYLTGNLNAAVLSRKSPAFQAKYTANVHADLKNAIAYAAQSGNEIQVPQSPNYLMVTGSANLTNVGRTIFGNTVVYVAETNTGIVLAYAVPWSREFHNADKPVAGQLMLRAGEQFSAALLRTE